MASKVSTYANFLIKFLSVSFVHINSWHCLSSFYIELCCHNICHLKKYFPNVGMFNPSYLGRWTRTLQDDCTGPWNSHFVTFCAAIYKCVDDNTLLFMTCLYFRFKGIIENSNNVLALVNMFMLHPIGVAFIWPLASFMTLFIVFIVKSLRFLKKSLFVLGFIHCGDKTCYVAVLIKSKLSSLMWK